MTEATITIVGMGPRGLSILQHLGERMSELPDPPDLRVHLVDPGDGGQGVHSAQQPPYLLTNTVASQVTMFTDARGPSFAQWAHEVGYRRFGDEYHFTAGRGGEGIGEHDYLPRSMLGEYLSWTFDRTVRSLGPSVRLIQHRDRVVDMEIVDSTRLAVRLERGFEIPSDYVFLATGHGERTASGADRVYREFVRANGRRNPHLAYCATPYPVARLQSIAPGADVAVQGLGLTAHDVLRVLTLGRGGRFDRDEDGVRYAPSGREPRIHLFSRQCLPASARGVNQKGVTGRYEAAFFTPEAIRVLRERSVLLRGSAKLDFEADVLPLLLREMGYAYRSAKQRRRIAPEEYEFGPEDATAVEHIVDPLRDRRFADHTEFLKFFVEYLSTDLEEAEAGNRTSPVKAATDVIRDTRAALREAVEFGALTPESHRAFTTTYVPLMNRIAFGPPRYRNRDLLALIDAGVVDLAGGPGSRIVTDRDAARFAIVTEYDGDVHTRHVDALVIARVDAFHPESEQSPLVRNLLRRGLIRPMENGAFRPGGIDVDRDSHPITAAGTTLPNVWAIGYLVEGARFYTHALPRHRMGSQFTDDARHSVDELFRRITGSGCGQRFRSAGTPPEGGPPAPVPASR